MDIKNKMKLTGILDVLIYPSQMKISPEIFFYIIAQWEIFVTRIRSVST